MSITVGAVEKVPYARNCPLPSKLSVVSEAGKTVIDSRGSAAAVVVTETDAVAVTTLLGLLPLAGFVHWAVMLVVPGLTPAAWPALAAG
jgi:hypothetical protein